MKDERKAQILEETMEAIADIKAGRVIDGAEIMEWLDTWALKWRSL